MDGIAGWEASYNQDGTREYLDQVKGRHERGRRGQLASLNHYDRRMYLHRISFLVAILLLCPLVMSSPDRGIPIIHPVSCRCYCVGVPYGVGDLLFSLPTHAIDFDCTYCKENVIVGLGKGIHPIILVSSPLLCVVGC